MNENDKKILNLIQENFPLVERPFEEIAKKVQIPEAEVISRIKDMRSNGVIRRFGVLINHKKLDYFSTLLGIRTSGDMLQKMVDFVTKRPEVTHCYQRDGEYDLWFTFLTPDKKIFEEFYSEVKKLAGAGNVLNLPTIKSFKLKTTFEV